MRRMKDLVKFRVDQSWTDTWSRTSAPSGQLCRTKCLLLFLAYRAAESLLWVTLSLWCITGVVIKMWGAATWDNTVFSIIADVSYSSWKQISIGNTLSAWGYLVFQLCYNMTAPSYIAYNAIPDWPPEAMVLKIISTDLPNLAGHYCQKGFSWCRNLFANAI